MLFLGGFGPAARSHRHSLVPNKYNIDSMQLFSIDIWRILQRILSTELWGELALLAGSWCCRYSPAVH